MSRRILSLAITIALASLGHAQDFKMEPGPKSPQDSLKCIKVRPGFKVELMVSEPLVQDPIAFAFGPDGKLWVVEMGDYPLGAGGKNKPGGRVKYLEKSKPGGPYDKMTVFLDNLGYPTGVFPYGKGVLVTCAPDIFYAERGKDGKVTKKVLFTGFREGNQQHRVNGLTWGIDNWIYGANGDSGGIVKSLKTGKSVDIRGRDFRFKLETGEFETVTGQSQFGRCRDDWGNWFGCNNSNPMYHFVLEDRYLKRNPYVLYPDPKVQVSVKPGASQVFPISKPLPRFNNPQSVNHFTSACSVIIYRDNLFGKEFEGNMFVCEPVHNLIHREIMSPAGVTFTSQRADDEQTSEFLASSDNWFRPTMIQVGPDGALWIADMYRYVIEHPEWIPKDWQKKLDLRAGHDKGRIYRVVPVGKKPREMVRLDKMDVKTLVKQLESPNGWVRDATHQLLIGKSINKNPAIEVKTAQAIEPLLTSKFPRARLHAVYCCDELYAAEYTRLEKMLKDPHPAIRKHALILLRDWRPRLVSKNFLALRKDESDPVRLQFALSLGGSKGTEAVLAEFLCENAGNSFIFAAALSSISKAIWKGLLTDTIKQAKVPTALFGPMLRMAKAIGEPLDTHRLFARQLSLQEKLPPQQLLVSAGEMLDTLEKNALPLKKLLEGSGEKDISKTLQRLTKIHADACNIVADPKAAPREKVIAIRLLGRGLGKDRDDQKLLVTLLAPQTPDNVQAAAIQQLSGRFDPRVPDLLLQPWKGYSPALRGQVLDMLFSRSMWTRMTLDAIQQKQVPAQEIDAIRRQRLLQHKEKQIRQRAGKIFAAASNPDRAKVVNLYWLQLPDKTDAARGAKLFAKSCAACHKLGGVGQNVGPDFAAIGDKSVQGLLTAILDPNRAVETRYINYVASTKKGQTFNGIIVSETSTSITLASNDGKQHQLLRNEIDDLSSTGKSLMPEGLEKDLTPRDMADIIAHVRANVPVLKKAPAK